MIDGILQGLATTLTAANLLMVLVGCFAGTFIGILPGLGPMSAIALLIPITYGFDPASSMILMAGVYYGAIFGGSTSSILINAPGESASIATTFDGYPLAKQGKAGKALAIGAYASFFGGTSATILLMVAAPGLASVALSFQSSDYFALMVLGLTAVAAFAGRGQFLKAMVTTILGLMLATVGQDVTTDADRFTFGSMDLLDGISFLLLAMATFALAEVLVLVLNREEPTDKAKAALRGHMGSLALDRAEVREIVPVMARSSLLGFLIGVLPGAGATIASFMAYGMERHLAPPDKQREFGHGSLRGLAAPEAASNAACSGAFVPLLTLGVPGSGTTALMLGALISYGVQPGPRLYVNHPDVFWSVILSMYIGNVILLILNLPLIPYIARILALPQRLLVPLVLFFSLIGVYLVSFNTFDIHLMVGFAVVAVMMRLAGFPMAPLILAFVLGRLMEENLRRSLIIYDGSLSFLWERPLTAVIMLTSLIILIGPLVGLVRKPAADRA